MINRLEALKKFLQSLNSLRKQGLIKTVDEAMAFAKQEFGEVNDLFKRQIEQIFKGTTPKAPPPGGGGITSIKNAPKKETTPQASGVETVNPYKPKKGLDLVEGMTRTIARSILNKKGIQVPERADPITVLEDNFGGDVLMDAKDVAEELIELERRGISTKSIDEVLEQAGMFDIKINKDAPKGMTDDELLKKIMGDVDEVYGVTPNMKRKLNREEVKKEAMEKYGFTEEEFENIMNTEFDEKILDEVDGEDILSKFDPKGRKPNAIGGIQRVAYRYGSGKSLIKFLKGKKNLIKKIKQAVDDIFKTDDIKYDADVAVDTMLEDLGVDRSMFDQKDIIDAYSMAYNELKIPLLQNLKNKPVKSMESMKKTGTLDISDPEIAGEMDRFAKQADPEGYKKMEDAMKKAADEAQPIEYFLGTRKKNSKGGLQYLMGL